MPDTIGAEASPRPKGKPWEFREAAAYLAVSLKHLRFLADSGRISSFRVGKRARRISDAEMARICREGV